MSQVAKKQNQFSFGFAVHTTESKSHSQSASPNKKQNKKNKQSPRKGRQAQQQVPDINVTTNEEDPTAKGVQFDVNSVSKLLNAEHLNAGSASAIHDLQCATGTLVLQV